MLHVHVFNQHLSAHIDYTMQYFQGAVTGSVTVINQDDIDDVTAAPGDLTIVDDEGETQLLQTYGKIYDQP